MAQENRRLDESLMLFCPGRGAADRVASLASPFLGTAPLANQRPRFSFSALFCM